MRRLVWIITATQRTAAKNIVGWAALLSSSNGGMMLPWASTGDVAFSNSYSSPAWITTPKARRSLVSFHGSSTGPHFFPARAKNPTPNTSTSTGVSGTSTSHHPNHLLNNERPPPDPSALLTNQKELDEQVDRLVDWWQNKNQVLCLTGAGLSTESGIPDYRGHRGSYQTGHKPMTHDAYIRSEMNRKRYWGRSMAGWRYFDQRQPNAGHFALRDLEQIGRLGVRLDDHAVYNEADMSSQEQQPQLKQGKSQRQLSLITQNVDGLHDKAGTRHLVELHGRGADLVCMNCGSRRDRHSFHVELERVNKDWLQRVLPNGDQIHSTSILRPDGDAALAPADSFENFQVPACTNCHVGFYKPDVVFFGDTVPTPRVALCSAAIEVCDGLLVVGTSLTVYSAFRHVRAAYQRGVHICIVNVGPTRVEAEGMMNDKLLKIEGPAGLILSGVTKHFIRQG